MRVLARVSLLIGLVVLAGSCGGDDDGQQAENTSAESDVSETTAREDDADGDRADVDVTEATGSGCGESGSADDDTTAEAGADPEDTGSADIDIGDDGISIEDGDDGVSIGEDGIDVNTDEGQVSVGEGGISIDSCFGDIDVEADDGGITISGPDGSVEISPDEAVTELGGEDTPEGIAIPLAESVLFDFDSAALRPESGEQLSLVAGLAATYPDAGIQIGGHTDTLGDDAYNQQLSEDRAGAVRDALGVLGVLGVANQRMTATGYGETRPLVAETTPDGADDPAARQQNRRVEILLVGADL